MGPDVACREAEKRSVRRAELLSGLKTEDRQERRQDVGSRARSHLSDAFLHLHLKQWAQSVDHTILTHWMTNSRIHLPPAGTLKLNESNSAVNSELGRRTHA